MTKLFSLSARKPNTLDEAAARKLEDAIAAKGEGVAGHADDTTQVHGLTSSPEPSAAQAKPEPAAVEVEPPVVDMVAAPRVRSTVSSRARGTAKSRTRELPTTGVGTMHNPRVRKVDGVQTRSTTVHLPVELAKRLAVHCAMTGRKQSDVIAEAVEAVLGA